MAVLSMLLAGAIWSVPDAHVTPSDGAPEDRFGSAVAVDGAHLLVGAPLQGDSGYRAGAVYAFEHDGQDWIESQQIRPDDLVAYGEFGSAIAIDGDLLAIGWKGSDAAAQGAGIVVLYEWSGGQWLERSRVWDPEATIGDRFGTSIDLDGDYMVVGCQLDDVSGSDSGSALVFRRSSDDWVFEQRLVPSGIGAYNWAGRSVSISGTRVVVGAYLESVDGQQAAGAAYVFERTGSGAWTEQARLVADDPVPGDYFGYSVSVEDDRIAVGSILNDAPLEDSGEVYLFEWTGVEWALQHLPPPDDGGEFGYTVAIDGERLHVGAVYHAGNGIANGAVYRFECIDGEWIYDAKWLPLEGADDCFFGASLSTDDGLLAIGAPRENIFGLGSGAAYVVDGSAPCDGDVTGDGGVGIDDLLAVIAGWSNPYDVDDLLLVIQSWGGCG